MKSRRGFAIVIANDADAITAPRADVVPGSAQIRSIKMRSIGIRCIPDIYHRETDISCKVLPKVYFICLAMPWL
jgi:hypothetical protein